MKERSRSPEPREPYCNRRWHSGSSFSLRDFFSFRFFMYFHCVCDWFFLWFGYIHFSILVRGLIS